VAAIVAAAVPGVLLETSDQALASPGLSSSVPSWERKKGGPEGPPCFCLVVRVLQ